MSGSADKNGPGDDSGGAAQGCAEIKLQIPAPLAAAFQRCSWILVQEKGQSRLESMEEMVRDFLIKHGC
ncbi:MAG: hypothetical protein P8X39_04980 [Desulfofustis sp.]|jgi:hypothetical protein